jgi:Abnormal spindle-like microcephaly-assoc'd, ASPM-SPD-2-Hydin
VRRLLGICAVAVVVCAALGFLRLNRVDTVSAANGPGSLELTAVPVIAGCPLGPSFTFCNQIPGTSSQPVGFVLAATAAVTNVSASLAAIPGLSSNFAAGDFTITDLSTCSSNLAANQQCTVFLAFSPTTTGLREAMLTVSDAAGDTLVINVEGTGATLEMVLPSLPPPCPEQPDNAVRYCNEPVGSASATQTFMLTSGSAITGLNLAFTAVPGLESEFNASNPDFTIESTTCTGTLAAFASCTASVAFTPAAAGLREAALTATDSQGDSAAVTLAGHTNTGLVIEGGGSEGSFSLCLPSPGFQFCNTPVGGSQQAAYTLTNASGTQITGLSVPTPVAGSNFTVASTSCVSTLAANATCTINVEFTPQTTGLLQGTIAATDNAGDIGAANFAGTGDDYNLLLANDQQIELTIEQGGTAVFNGEVLPDSVFGQNGESVEFVCPLSSTMPTNTSCVISPCQATITPGTATPFTITFVTSSATVVAPVPPQSTGCTSYGPSPTVLVRGPSRRNPLGGPRFFLSLSAVTFAAFGLFLGWLTVGRKAVRRKQVQMVLATAGLAGAFLVGCHHGNGNITGPATPVGTTTMTATGKAVDSSGDSLNTSRAMPQITLDVITQPNGGGGFP